MTQGRHQVTGWLLDPADRARLLKRFPPRFADVGADHVTLRFGTDAHTPLPLEHHGEAAFTTSLGLSIAPPAGRQRRATM